MNTRTDLAAARTRARGHAAGHTHGQGHAAGPTRGQGHAAEGQGAVEAGADGLDLGVGDPGPTSRVPAPDHTVVPAPDDHVLRHADLVPRHAVPHHDELLKSLREPV